MAKFNQNDTIGGYRIIRPLGEGGMGAVYEVEHTQLGVHYAMKTFALADDSHVDLLKNKFLAEGKVLARLHHPNIVRVFDLNFDERTHTPYFVMDLVLGADGNPRTLADVECSEIDEECVRRWFVELAAALDYVHAQGIIHRDIKLSNILVNADNEVVLSDFGISRLFSDNLRREVSAVYTMVSAATCQRLVMGTHGYMAPEVERGEEATPAADVYSLGVLIVHLLTGVWYEPGSKALRLLDTFDLPWGHVIPQMLADNPKDRPTDLASLAKELVGREVPSPPDCAARSAAPTGRAVSMKPPRTLLSRKQTLTILLCAAIVLAVATAAVSMLSGRETSEDDFDTIFGYEELEVK